MGDYASVADVKARLIPYQFDNALFSDEKLDELIEYREGEIEGVLDAQEITSPVTATKAVAVLKQKVISAVVADVLLQSNLAKDDPRRDDLKMFRQDYLDWLSALRNGKYQLPDVAVVYRQNNQLAVASIDLDIDYEDDEEGL